MVMSNVMHGACDFEILSVGYMFTTSTNVWNWQQMMILLPSVCSRTWRFDISKNCKWFMNPYIYFFFVSQKIFFIPLKLKLISIKNENFPLISVDRHRANVSIFTGNLSWFFSVLFLNLHKFWKERFWLAVLLHSPEHGQNIFLCSSLSHLFTS
jgi:hypothetical protein